MWQYDSRLFLKQITSQLITIVIRVEDLQVTEDGEVIAVIEGVPAGGALSDLAVLCSDETGKPAQPGTAGKLQVSWTRGTKKVKLGEEPMQLPDLQVTIFLLHSFRGLTATHLHCLCPAKSNNRSIQPTTSLW